MGSKAPDPPPSERDGPPESKPRKPIPPPPPPPARTKGGHTIKAVITEVKKHKAKHDFEPANYPEIPDSSKPEPAGNSSDKPNSSGITAEMLSEEDRQCLKTLKRSFVHRMHDLGVKPATTSTWQWLARLLNPEQDRDQ